MLCEVMIYFSHIRAGLISTALLMTTAGALLDMTFYYNSASNDPYDTRGYNDAVYLSGEYAPVTLRDNRILECNEQVQDVDGAMAEAILGVMAHHHAAMDAVVIAAVPTATAMSLAA